MRATATRLVQASAQCIQTSHLRGSARTGQEVREAAVPRRPYPRRRQSLCSRTASFISFEARQPAAVKCHTVFAHMSVRASEKSRRPSVAVMPAAAVRRRTMSASGSAGAPSVTVPARLVAQ